MDFKEELKELVEKARKAQNIDDWDKVIQQGEELKQKTPKRKDKRQVEQLLAKAYNDRGKIYFSQEEYQKAIKDFDKAVNINPNYVSAYYHRGNAYLAQEESQAATENFKEAVKLAKEDIDENSIQIDTAKEFILTRKELYLTAQHEEFNDNDNSLFTGKLNDKTLEPLLKLWQVVKEIKKDHEIGDEEKLKLAHYTSLEMIHKLLPRKKDEKDKESHFRLNDARGMNDPEEGKSLINEVEVLNDFYNEQEQEQEPNSHTFIASFVKEKDENTEEGENALLMWRLYGKDARGAKLTFPIQDSHRNYSTDSVQTNFSSNIFKKDSETTKDSKTTIPSSPLPMAIYKVKYGTIEKEDAKNENENKNKISEILKPLGSNNLDIKEYVRNIIDEIRFLYKNEVYGFENEYRIVWVVSNIDPRIKVNEENNNLYMEAENNDFLFKQKESTVWIGTAVPKKELVRDVVKVNLRDMKYEDCKVKTSNLKYVPSSK